MAGIVESTKSFIGESMLSFKLSKLERRKALVNITQATSIGLVYKVKDEVMFNTVKSLIKEISNEKRQVMALGFVDDFSIPDYCVAAFSGYYFNKKAALNSKTKRTQPHLHRLIHINSVVYLLALN